MTRLKRVMSFAAVVLSMSSALSAQTVAAGTYVFGSVTGIQYATGGTTITGVLANDTAPTTYALPAASSYCSDNLSGFLSTMISNPGTYTLTLVVTNSGVPGAPASITSCSLSHN